MRVVMIGRGAKTAMAVIAMEGGASLRLRVQKLRGRGFNYSANGNVPTQGPTTCA